MTPSIEPDGIKLPLVGTWVRKPARGSVAWYLGLGAMAALELIEWPIALVVATGHALSTHADNPEVREFAEGTEAGT